MENSTTQDARVQQVHAVIKRLANDGTVVAGADGSTHSIFPVAASPTDGEVLRQWVVQADATQTLKIGLGYGMSALVIGAVEVLSAY